jgi:hypothetical protein
VKRNIACFCDKAFEEEIPESVDLAAEPNVEAMILQGEFMVYACPACGKRLAPEYPCLVSGVKGGTEIFFLPENDRTAYMRGRLEYRIGNPARIAIGFPELVEKVRIFGKGLDDRVVEIMKYYLLTGSAREPDVEAAEGARENADIILRYAGEDGGSHMFHIEGLKQGEIGVARLAREIYRKIESDIERRVKEEPFRQFCEPPHVSLRRLG